MTSDRDALLRHVREALRDVPDAEQPDAVAVPRDYCRSGALAPVERARRFAERVAEYRARVDTVREGQIAEAVAQALRRRGAARLVVPADAPDAWLPPTVAPLRDAGQLSHRELDRCDGVLTGCALGIAQTGTIVLDHGPRQGRRAISLLPDYHLCLVWAAQIVELVPEAIAQLRGAAGRPLTFISGPSATSDIELSRVEGVHGPRTLEVLIVTPDA